MYRYCFGEADGPFRCKTCGELTWNIFSENKYSEGRKALLYDGQALCKRHEPENISQRTFAAMPLQFCFNVPENTSCDIQHMTVFARNLKDMLINVSAKNPKKAALIWMREVINAELKALESNSDE